MSLTGHFWTIAPSLLHGWFPRAAPPARPYATTLEDSRAGSVKLTGALRVHEASDACLVVVHGLGGSPDAFYCVRAAWAAEQRMLSCLRLSLRGADRSGEDFYHAGLTADLDAAIASPELARFERIYLLGYSLGGHVGLRFALTASDPRVRGVAAICAPLDLELSAQAIDRPFALPYRRHILDGLKDIYRAVAARKAVPTPLARVLAARSLREWDALTVVPRFGFESVDHYYSEMSAGPRLGFLNRPALLVQSSADPMVPPWAYETHLREPIARLRVERLANGGHVGFPAKLRLGPATHASVEAYVIDWLLRC